MPPNPPNNSEIDAALKEFEAKQNAEQNQKSPEVLKNSDLPKMVQLVIKSSGGAIKEQKQAEWVLLFFVIISMTVSLFLFFGMGNTAQKTSHPVEPIKLTPANH